MSDIALRVEGLGKRYRIGRADSGGGMYHYKSLRDAFGNVARDPIGALKSTLVREPMTEANSFWALSDVNFEVKRGEVVGIIGRNGAGKSTLLKILSRITKPTTGRVDLYGRVGSLLEVGTGFHPELSGRENIYLNGAILGMTRTEVKSKFDEIVAFSEIEKFLDTQVKQYSSGMYMRLAFAVAAHLDPEILVIDEVLAVGDAAFQSKCLGKMRDVAQHGKTVLFVSHNMPAVTTLCETGVVLAKGEMAFKGDSSEASMFYLRSGGAVSAEDAVYRPKRPTGAIAWVESIELFCDGRRSTFLDSGGDLMMRIHYAAESEIQPIVGIVISSVDGIRLIHASLRNMGGLPDSVPRQRAGEIDVTVPKLCLTPGDYEITVHFGDRAADHHPLHSCMRFTVNAIDHYRSGQAYQSRDSYLWSLISVTANGVRCNYSDSFDTIC